MSPWRQKAEGMFPELAYRFEEAESPYQLWFELLMAFNHAYDQTPRDEALGAFLNQ